VQPVAVPHPRLGAWLPLVNTYALLILVLCAVTDTHRYAFGLLLMTCSVGIGALLGWAVAEAGCWLLARRRHG
jgi:uncharacterized protein (TIGR03382 family)